MNRDERIERVFNTIAGIKNGYGQATPALRLMAEAIVDDLPTLIEADMRAKVLADLREFLPEWNYPPDVVAAICLELKARSHD